MYFSIGALINNEFQESGSGWNINFFVIFHIAERRESHDIDFYKYFTWDSTNVFGASLYIPAKLIYIFLQFFFVKYIIPDITHSWFGHLDFGSGAAVLAKIFLRWRRMTWRTVWRYSSLSKRPHCFGDWHDSWENILSPFLTCDASPFISLPEIVTTLLLLLVLLATKRRKVNSQFFVEVLEAVFATKRKRAKVACIQRFRGLGI